MKLTLDLNEAQAAFVKKMQFAGACTPAAAVGRMIDFFLTREGDDAGKVMSVAEVKQVAARRLAARAQAPDSIANDLVRWYEAALSGARVFTWDEIHAAVAQGRWRASTYENQIRSLKVMMRRLRVARRVDFNVFKSGTGIMLLRMASSSQKPARGRAPDLERTWRPELDPAPVQRRRRTPNR